MLYLIWCEICEYKAVHFLKSSVSLISHIVTKQSNVWTMEVRNFQLEDNLCKSVSLKAHKDDANGRPSAKEIVVVRQLDNKEKTFFNVYFNFFARPRQNHSIFLAWSKQGSLYWNCQSTYIWLYSFQKLKCLRMKEENNSKRKISKIHRKG